MLARIFVVLQYVLPQHLITALVYRVARVSHAGTKNFLITKFISLYDVCIDDVKLNVP